MSQGYKTCYASAARAATPTAMADQYNPGNKHKGIRVVIDITGVTATPAVTVTIQGKDELSGQYYTILASAALATVSTTVLTVYPGATVASNLVANNTLPLIWRVITTHGDSDSATYSVSAELLP